MIIGPLDMKDLLEAVTVTLMYGAGHAFQGQMNFHLYDYTIGNSPTDPKFVKWCEENQ